MAKRSKTTLLVVHCTATPEGREHTVADIRGWHKAQGWADIGYHYVVHLNGEVSPGRPEEDVGAHVAGQNSHSIGIVYVGGVDKNGKPKDTRTPEQRDALVRLTEQILKKYPTITRVAGHNEFAAKACPSFDVRKEPTLGRYVNGASSLRGK